MTPEKYGSLSELVFKDDLLNHKYSARGLTQAFDAELWASFIRNRI
jgi:hypothetical protein